MKKDKKAAPERDLITLMMVNNDPKNYKIYYIDNRMFSARSSLIYFMLLVILIDYTDD